MYTYSYIRVTIPTYTYRTQKRPRAMFRTPSLPITTPTAPTHHMSSQSFCTSKVRLFNISCSHAVTHGSAPGLTQAIVLLAFEYMDIMHGFVTGTTHGSINYTSGLKGTYSEVIYIH